MMCFFRSGKIMSSLEFHELNSSNEMNLYIIPGIFFFLQKTKKYKMTSVLFVAFSFCCCCCRRCPPHLPPTTIFCEISWHRANAEALILGVFSRKTKTKQKFDDFESVLRQKSSELQFLGS